MWSRVQGINYHEMLILYTIREYGYCTQKQICDSYILPKQTIHNVITALRRKGILVQDEENSKNREKVFILSEKGNEYVTGYLNSLDAIESCVLEKVGTEKLQELTELLFSFDSALNTALKENFL